MNSSTKRDNFRYLVENYKEPLIFKDVIKWKILEWDLEGWKRLLQDNKLLFRKNSLSNSETPCWERNCPQICLTMEEFIKYQLNQDLPSSLYFDYKYMHEHFEDNPEFLECISWKDFGYPEKTGRDSTIWMGTKGAHTPCHIDTYGCNLVLQVYGSKEWILFPPGTDLKSTRVPYEESSVYSKLNFFTPKPELFTDIQGARTVVLKKGDVLFVPNSWWHYVENLETAISINTWIPLKQDSYKRVEESLTQLLVQQVVRNSSECVKNILLNPNSDDISDMSQSQLLAQLKLSANACKTDQPTQQNSVEEIFPSPSKRNRLKGTDPAMDSSGVCCKIIDMYRKIHKLPPLASGQLVSLMLDKKGRYNISERNESTQSDNLDADTCREISLLKSVINAFCKPENLSRATETFLNEYGDQ